MLCLIHTYNTYLSIHPSIYLAHIWPWIDSYRYSLLGDEHPFATYFDVHQGYIVLTHSHMYIYIYIISMSGLIHISPIITSSVALLSQSFTASGCISPGLR